MSQLRRAARRAFPVLLLLLFNQFSTVRAADDADLFAGQTRAHLTQLARTEGLSGVVLVARHGRPLLKQAYGYSNLADRVSNRVDTRFNMASMGKMITAVAVLQLAEAGKLSLQERVGRYLPDYPNEQVRQLVTIEQLLTHTSGMGNFWTELADKPKERYSAVADYVPLFASQPLLFEPGQGFAYSNSGYTLLGLVIEAVSGQTYFDYVREKIYRPSGMNDTDAFRLDEPVARMATGYSRSAQEPGKMISNLYVNTFKGGPAGGSYTTADDMLRFANALMNFRLLTPQYTELLTRGKVDYRTRRYAYGFTEETANGHRLIGHSGGHVGIANELMIFTDLGYTVVVLTNGEVENFWDIQHFVKRSLLGPTPDAESYAFTRSLLDATISAGYAAGARRLEGRGHPVLRGGLMEQVGNKLLWQGKNPQAEAVFRLYAMALPDDAYAHLGLGTAREQTGDKAGAIEAYERYLSMEPSDKEVAEKLLRLRSAAAMPGAPIPP